MIPPDKLEKKPEQSIPSARPPRKGKVAGTLLAAGAAAVVSVYTVGYMNTAAGSNDLTAIAPVPSATAAAPTATPGTIRQQPAANPRYGATATPTPSTSQTGGSTQTGAYANGTYVGSGTSRHGGMQVTVVISGGKITSAAVTSCNTRYPCSDIASLVTAVVSQQAVPVNHVSGATDSSNAYKQAVSSALGNARAAVAQ